ncbi:MAG: tRNA (guanosine(46)-N7)-methyltransferase TrmB, partial [Bacteroidaceae bacterium]|nr:tRNA (guanosine(46)-N7)-methyltransferase TrmB [Bacteroidaceae bacterium]
MGKGKLAKFADMASNPLVVERPFRPGDTPERIDWHKDFFKNDNPIILELGCGRGEYTVGMGRLYPQNNYLGVDIKGARMWTGAQEALKDGMTNVGFLRTNIEFIDQFFAPSEVAEIWLTFSDPQMKKATKRLTSTYFLQRYRKILCDGGIVHLKTDSNFLFTYTEEMLKANNLQPLVCT